MPRRFCLILAASLVLAGCNTATSQEAQYDDSRNPFYKQAEQDLDNNNPAAAVHDYELALGANPKLAGAHYQMGIIYGDKLNDPISAVYHLKRYLELAPNSDKSDQVKAMIDKQSMAFAAALPNSPAQSADDYAKLQADNATLKKQVEDAGRTITQLQTQLADAKQRAAAVVISPPAAASPASPAGGSSIVIEGTGLPPVVTTAPANPAMPTTPPRARPLDDTTTPPLFAPASATNSATAGPSRTYKVVSGDSLWKISHKMYPHDTLNGIDKIKEANKDTLIEGKPLKIGQVLIIP